MSKPWVYITSPYSKGDQALNVRTQHRVWNVLIDAGCVPIAPLWSHYQHLAFPRPYQDWIDYDMAIIERCDACLRLDAKHDGLDYIQKESSGADNEVLEFLAAGKPVFFRLSALEEWLAEQAGQRLAQ